MDTWALIIIGGSIVGYLASKKHAFFVLTLGVGVGLLWGALWAAALISRAFS